MPAEKVARLSQEPSNATTSERGGPHFATTHHNIIILSFGTIQTMRLSFPFRRRKSKTIDTKLLECVVCFELCIECINCLQCNQILCKSHVKQLHNDQCPSCRTVPFQFQKNIAVQRIIDQTRDKLGIVVPVPTDVHVTSNHSDSDSEESSVSYVESEQSSVSSEESSKETTEESEELEESFRNLSLPRDSLSSGSSLSTIEDDDKVSVGYLA